MRLEDDELVFYDFEWVVSNNTRSDDKEYVSPFFGLDISPHIKESCPFRFGIRLIQTEDQLKAVLYLYVHFLDILSVGITDVECFIQEKHVKLFTTFHDAQTLIFESHEFRPIECMFERIFHVHYRIYPTNYSFGLTIDRLPLGDYGFQQFDTNFGVEMWAAARNQLLTDCQFIVNQTIFHAHRVIVASRCPALVDWNNFDGKTACQITVSDTDERVFEALLYFLYTGQVMSIDPEMYPTVSNLIIKYVKRNASDIFEAAPTLVDEQSSVTESPVDISENNGRITLIRRGLSVEYNYETRFKSWDSPAPAQTAWIHNKGKFSIALKKLIVLGEECDCQLDVGSIQLVNGFDLVGVACYRPGTKSHLIISKGDKYRIVLDLPVNPKAPKDTGLPKDRKLSTTTLSDQYYIITGLEICLAEVYDTWGYRLRDLLLAGNLWSIYTTKESVDIQLKMVDHLFYAHQAILSARSSVFAQLFNLPDKLNVVDIEPVDPFAFEEFLYFLYTGTLRTMEYLQELRDIAIKYDVKTLKEISQSV